MISIDAFCLEAQAFLDQNAALKGAEQAFVWGVGSDDVVMLEEPAGDQVKSHAEAKRWARLRFDAGFGWIDGPVELGGRGLTAEHVSAYRALEDRYDIPLMTPLHIAEGFVAPTVLAHGSPELCREVLPAMYRGDLIVCQLFSEPNAGSDLAAARTKAVRDGDEWVITGQKVWTSRAHIADVGLAVTRTNPEAPKHRGLTLFLIDMHAPGVEVRPLRQMTGGADFNEVFLTDVRVSDARRVGEVDGGFGVILTTLGNERTMGMRASGLAAGPAPFAKLLALVEHHGDRTDPVVRQRLASHYSTEKIGEWMMARMAAALEAGGQPGAEMSILKLASHQQVRDVVALLSQVLGSRLTADTGEWGTFAWTSLVLGAPGGGIGGGTSEIIRNTLAERVLGLPREAAVPAATSAKEMS
jgi:alkylation response protein AidB-like acyl-CoA dehydrogenase